ncbi:hypothetical protein [Candidatus Tisiphia endosymbiont of Nemotelus uliginosus]|uniref:hypothetical protein n=1 Tax=Candidatus Tisiphia endosymbiont of Nemotelus uliginosus TaxID=3077926 RepID=UPI0035C8E722
MILVKGFLFLCFIVNIALAYDKNVDTNMVPFTRLSTQNHQLKLSISEALPHDVTLYLNINKKIQFGQNLPIKVLEYSPNKLVVFTRPLLDTGMSVLLVDLKKDFKITKIEISENLKNNGYFREAIVFKKDIYFINYCPENAHPSQEGDVNVLYKIESDPQGNFFFNEKFQVNLNRDQDIRYGIDRKIHLAGMTNNSILICSGFECYTLSVPSNILTTLPLPEQYSIVELASSRDAQQYIALISKGNINESQYAIFDPINHKILKKIANITPFNLQINEKGHFKFDILIKENIEKFLNYKILNSKDSGLLELGMSNDQARIAWSTVYYLNAFIDVLSKKIGNSFNMLSDEFKNKLRTRLEIEMILINSILKDGVNGIKSTRYSTKQQPRIYAVQSGRILRLMKRYQMNFNKPLSSYQKFKNQVENLDFHEEMFFISDEQDIDFLPQGRISLKWPKNIDFPFDGFKIPFNHQDDWASGVTYGGNLVRSKEARDIIFTLLERSEIKDATLNNFEWKYWFGRVAQPWNIKDGLSKNTPEYYGDRGFADISYKTIDVMALLTVSKIYPDLLSDDMLKQIVLATQKGLLFPFVQEDLMELYNININLEENAARNYLICDSAWCISNVIWALKDI